MSSSMIDLVSGMGQNLPVATRDSHLFDIS